MKTQSKENAKHTPGPWKINDKVMGQQVQFGRTSDDKKWGWAAIEGVNKEANARLIAAAPEMIQELKRLHQGCACLEPQEKGNPCKTALLIAKAEGK